MEWPAYPIIYAMRVTDVIGFDEFKRRNPEHFNPHSDTRGQVATDRVLISEDFIYWGGGGPLLPREFSVLIKPKGPGHLCNFPQCVVRAFMVGKSPRTECSVGFGVNQFGDAKANLLKVGTIITLIIAVTNLRVPVPRFSAVGAGPGSRRRSLRGLRSGRRRGS